MENSEGFGSCWRGVLPEDATKGPGARLRRPVRREAEESTKINDALKFPKQTQLFRCSILFDRNDIKELLLRAHDVCTQSDCWRVRLNTFMSAVSYLKSVRAYLDCLKANDWLPGSVLIVTPYLD